VSRLPWRLELIDHPVPDADLLVAQENTVESE
jgi:hypothetical protein